MGFEGVAVSAARRAGPAGAARARGLLLKRLSSLPPHYNYFMWSPRKIAKMGRYGANGPRTYIRKAHRKFPKNHKSLPSKAAHAGKGEAATSPTPAQVYKRAPWQRLRRLRELAGAGPCGRGGRGAAAEGREVLYFKMASARNIDASAPSRAERKGILAPTPFPPRSGPNLRRQNFAPLISRRSVASYS
ncbi:hypothetical protein EVAR_14563_1 [Eumeta japonica]|uniref:Uncharacterized protein n=1 Tax=Eumeta variegata TaxID=151549 RepID=A0A4C1UVM2_EUMVA|nr:hypothetical protein EVAR_14563_1 [Eumeta japonica]